MKKGKTKLVCVRKLALLFWIDTIKVVPSYFFTGFLVVHKCAEGSLELLSFIFLPVAESN